MYFCLHLSGCLFEFLNSQSSLCLGFRYFLLQRCWQFVATERPSFSTIGSDLMHMAVKPTRHIILKSTKDPAKPGYVSENGQVFLRALPPHALEDDEPPQKKTRRSSGTLRSLISSIDDTVYTRETAETVLDLTPSETENEFYNNYERYLKGDLPLLNVAKRRSYEETDTSGNDANTREKIRPRSSRKSSKSTARDGRGENADEASTGKASGTSSSKRKKKRSMGSVNREKAHKASPGLAKRVFLPQTAPGGGVAPHEDSGDVSSIGAPSTEEEENKGGRATSDLSGSEGSQVDLVRL